MKLKIKKLRFFTGRPVCIIHEKTARQMSLHVGKRVSIKNKKGKKIISIVDTATGIIKPKEIAVSESIIHHLNPKNHEVVNVQLAERPHSISLIKEKLKGKHLKKHEIKEIVENIANNALTEVEIAFFVSAVYTKGMSMQETKNLTQAMVDTGNVLKLRGKVVDKHSIGGIAGNRTTPLVISICAAAGLILPKTSSRAITSAAGTADVVETLAKVDFSIRDIKKIVKKTNACMVWGGALGLAPVDDKIIRIEKIVNIDSPPQVLASILSKKLSVGSKYVLIDIPYGKGAKVSRVKAEKLKSNFLTIGKHFGLKINVVLTDGSEPIGRGIGPVLEMKDILKVLTRTDPPLDLEEKSIFLSGELLELAGKAKKGKGDKMAREILTSKKALKKFLEIVKEQKGLVFDKKNALHIPHFKEPPFIFSVKAKKKVKIKHMDNKFINKLARAAGCPEDKLAGIYLNKKKNQEVKKGEPILTIQSVSKEKMNFAKNFWNENKNQMVEFY